MGEMVNEEVMRQNKLTNLELLKEYGQQIVSSFPSEIKLKAIRISMEKRKIVPKNLFLSLKYDDMGEEKVLHLMSV